MKVLVTGAGGFLGTALIERLLSHGEMDLRLFVQASSCRKMLDALAASYPSAKLELVVGNLAEMEHARRAVDGVDVVYHLVAARSGAATEVLQTTVVTSKNLLDAIAQITIVQRPRVVLVSSFGVYGVATLSRGALIDEKTPVEPHPELRDVYSQAKLWQENLFWEYRAKYGFQLVVVRPGVIYGPGGIPISARVGLSYFGIFLHLGGSNILPLTYVDNCAEGIALVGRSPEADGQVYNLVDDDLPTCSEFLRQYRMHVDSLCTVRVPYFVTMVLSLSIKVCNKLSPRKLPAIFTPYRAATSWGGNRFSNSKIKSLGFVPIVSTREGLTRVFASLSKK